MDKAICQVGLWIPGYLMYSGRIADIYIYIYIYIYLLAVTKGKIYIHMSGIVYYTK
jgi:hypothetical protein